MYNLLDLNIFYIDKQKILRILLNFIHFVISIDREKEDTKVVIDFQVVQVQENSYLIMNVDLLSETDTRVSRVE